MAYNDPQETTTRRNSPITKLEPPQWLVTKAGARRVRRCLHPLRSPRLRSPGLGRFARNHCRIPQVINEKKEGIAKGLNSSST